MPPAMPPQLRDEFDDSPARAAVVSIVRGFGAVQRLMTPHYAQFGLTPPQFQLLTVANRLRNQPLTQRDLAKALYVSFPNVTVMLSRLEAAGLIERQINPDDRRQKFVRLTRKARFLLRRIWKKQPQQLERVVKGLGKTERKTLAHLLNKLTASHLELSEAESAVSTEVTP